MQHTAPTTDHGIFTAQGPRTVQATEPVPGLLVYRIPDDVNTTNPRRWTLGHKSGVAIASFGGPTSATAAAHAVADIADWSRGLMEARQVLSEARNDFWDLITANGGWHPDDNTPAELPTPKRPAIPAQTANHVLFHFGAGGYQAGSFTQQLLTTIAMADPANQNRLAHGFPNEVAAVQLAQNDPDGITRLQRIAGGDQ